MAVHKTEYGLMFPKQAKFLVVDDFATMRQVVVKILRELRYEKIDEAETGKEALHLFQQALASNSPYACVVSDWNMPQMTGIELLKILRADPKSKNIPFILATADGESDFIIEAARAGVSQFIIKPFSPEAFADKLRKAFEKHANHI